MMSSASGSRGHAVGPLEPLRDGFREALHAEGYAPKPVELHLALFSHLSCWLGERELTAGDLTAGVVEEFFVERRVRYRWLATPRAAGPLLRHLMSIGLGPAEPDGQPRADAVSELVEVYRVYLVRQRGLAAGSVELYVRHARRFVGVWWPSGDVDAGGLDAASVVGLVRRELVQLSASSARTSVCVLRSFLRFLHATGMTPYPLADAVPSVADPRRGSIPRYLAAGVVAGLVESCDTATPTGRRDAAILVVLARLALRAGEVAGLCLEHLDWRAGELVVAGKGGRVERLPLPCDVGEAIVAYLVDGRPRVGGRSVFVGVSAPHAPLSRSGVKSVVYRACDRVGMDRVGPHRLRHTAATETLRAGGSLSEVAQLLRHRRVETTAIYAKVDRVSLQALALPWPGGAS